MNWSAPHILAGIALVAALFGAGAVWFPGTDAKVPSVGLILAVLLLSVAVLIT